KAEQAWGEARGKAEQAWGDARSRVRTFQEDAEQYVRENPTKAVFTALGIGFVLGLIFRRLIGKTSTMTSESPQSPNPAGHSGLVENALALLTAAADFFESRLALAAKESKSAALQILIMIGSLLFAGLLCVMGYVFLIVSAIAGLAHLAGTSWPW